MGDIQISSGWRINNILESTRFAELVNILRNFRVEIGNILETKSTQW